MYAKVIVDVPAKLTNRPFDYAIPQAMSDWIDVGSRVGVPFGGRLVQGFVVERSFESETESSKVKAIQEILDIVPPLNRELVHLADWMSETYLCHKITALQAMIPGALKATAERRIALHSERNMVIYRSPIEETVIQFLTEKGAVLIETLIERFPEASKHLKAWIRQGWLVEVRSMKDRLAKKKVLTVYVAVSSEQLLAGLAELSAQAKRQKDVLLYLAEHIEPIALSELSARLQVSASVIKGLAYKGWIEIRASEIFRDPYAERTFQPSQALQLTEEQEQVVRPLCEALQQQQHKAFLLHGVTGSGKTEVYLQAIQQCLSQGREAIVLVPEIALTAQMVDRFKSRFGDLVAVLHSRLSQGERYDEWRKIAMQHVKVVIGARSAVFAPFSKLGLIIIDEEHESSYKQEESPKYHAREVALIRGRSHQAVVVLGSATPSLESYYETLTDWEHTQSGIAESSKMHLLSMPSRVEGRPLPEVNIIDLRQELKDGNRSMFSLALHEAIADRLHKQEQIVLLLNRRGYSTFVMCRTCGFVAQCPHCDISLTYHQNSHMMRCHYCGYAEREVQACPSCGSAHIRHFGTGTQRVEEELAKLFPDIRVIRMDVDTTSEKGSHEKWINMFKNRQADVLLGTQMVAKGLDFPHVTLVGVIAADTVLHLPDFRASEKTFQLLTQVAGRAGRHELKGEVYIQTYTPEHYSITYASQHDYNGFLQQELGMRKEMGYPPYSRLILITLSHEQVPFLVRAGETLVRHLNELGTTLTSEFGTNQSNFMDVLGPVASPIPRIKDRYRFQCVVKYRGDQVSAIVANAVNRLDDLVRQNKLQISVDVNPQVLM